MSTYKLIALDMDGTLLNSSKEISQPTIDMINRAFAEGKEVVLSTGRCIPELRSTFSKLPALRYAICISGALIYDIHEKKIIASHPISDDLCEKLLQIAETEKPMIHLLESEDSVVEKSCIPQMEKYHMGIYTKMFEEVTSPANDIYQYFKEERKQINKFNMYFTDHEARTRTLEMIKGQNLPMEVVFAEETSLECSAKNVSKGNGLKELCQYLHIPLEETIAVGDADNDLVILKTAGLSVAMGNANENVKNVCKVTVADNDHDGCAEAIEKYLLS